jgi:hypothetical protein
MARLDFMARAAGALASLLLLAACSDNAPKPGEVMVVISTDMAVPSDIDELSWSVTLEGGSKPFEQGTFALTSNADLPATISVLAGPSTNKPVKIEVQGLKGRTESGRVRVSRSARVLVDGEGTKTLPMPLDWLCSDGNLGEDCPTGQTCEAGRCVDATIGDAQRLSEYVAPKPTACFDVVDCFTNNVRFRAPLLDPTTGECTVSGTEFLGDGSRLSLALQLDTTNLGAYGFCSAVLGCVIPLNRGDGPNEWHLDNIAGAPVGILPAAVCDAFPASVKYVAALDATSSCPNKTQAIPTCAPPPDSCFDADICPTNWSTDYWHGYVCTGDATPFPDHDELYSGWGPALAPGAKPPFQNGRFCSTSGEQPSSDPLVIDDMSDGPMVKTTPPKDLVAGGWFTSLGDGTGDLWPPPNELFTYRDFDSPEQRDGGPPIEHAACLESNGFGSWVAMEGFDFAWLRRTYGAQSVDLSGYAGISFWGKNWDPFDAELSVEVHLPNVQTSTAQPSECQTPADGASRCDDFHATVELGSTWQKYSIRFSELAQTRLDWNPPQFRYPKFDPHVYSTSFIVPGAGTDPNGAWLMSEGFDFCIADIRFIAR